MKMTVEKFKDVMNKKCPCCGETLRWEYVGQFRADCCGIVYVAEPHVMVLIEEDVLVDFDEHNASSTNKKSNNEMEAV